MTIALVPVDVLDMHAPSTCGGCGFELGSTSSDSAVDGIQRAGEAFTPLVRIGDPHASEEAFRARTHDGWSVLEYLVHVSETLDATRREIFRIVEGSPISAGARARIEAPHAADPDTTREAALAELSSAAVWLARSIDALPQSRRDQHDVRHLIIRAAHEIVHHRDDVASLLSVTGH